MIHDEWIRRALEVPRAFGQALGTGRLRVEPEDFIVDEDLGFAPAGAGPHVLVRVRKRNANTEWVAREIAKALGCRASDVGFAGLKDRHAVTSQWFSIPSPRGAAYVQDTIGAVTQIRREDFEVLEAHAHTRKLPRGALAGNRFTLRVRDVSASDESIAERIEAIARYGVPNYFGPQRFGREGSNLRRIPEPSGPEPSREGASARIHPRERTYVLSAARSLIFNAVLAERIGEGTWSRLETGDVANLDSTGSVFSVESVDELLMDRVAALDVHPTGPMWGKGELLTHGRIQDLERRIGASLEAPCALVIDAGMNQERRGLRLAVRELDWRREPGGIVLSFWLTKGSYATTVLRELFEVDSEDAEES